MAESDPTKEAPPTRQRREEPEVPKGFTTRVGRERGDGWLVKSAGQIIQGRLLGRYTMKGQQNDDGTSRTFYQVKLSGDHKVRANFQDPDTKEKSEVLLEGGAILNVDEHKALEDLEPYTQDGGVYNVWWKYEAEEPIKGRKNMTFWRLKGPFLEQIRPPTHRPMQAAPAVRRGEDDQDIPF